MEWDEARRLKASHHPPPPPKTTGISAEKYPPFPNGETSTQTTNYWVQDVSFRGGTNRCWFCTPTNPAAIFLFHLRSRMLIEQVVWHSNIYSDGIAERQDFAVQTHALRHFARFIDFLLLKVLTLTCSFFPHKNNDQGESLIFMVNYKEQFSGHWAPRGKKKHLKTKLWKRWFNIFLRMDPASLIVAEPTHLRHFSRFFWGQIVASRIFVCTRWESNAEESNIWIPRV